MSKQIEITEPTPLLRDDGLLTQPGYCKRNIFRYNREKISASKWRIKEWDFYQICDGHYMVQLNFADISLGSAVTVDVRDLHTGKVLANTLALEPLTANRSIMTVNGETPFYFTRKMAGATVIFDVKETTRRLYFSGLCMGKRLQIDMKADKLPDQESRARACLPPTWSIRRLPS